MSVNYARYLIEIGRPLQEALIRVGISMSGNSRKVAIAAYKERKVAAGIYVVDCMALDRQWVGQAADLSTIWNRLSFELRHGGNRCRTLQAAWTAHGPETFVFREVERLDDEAVAYVRNRALKERLAHWRDTLKAEAI